MVSAQTSAETWSSKIGDVGRIPAKAGQVCSHKPISQSWHWCSFRKFPRCTYQRSPSSATRSRGPTGEAVGGSPPREGRRHAPPRPRPEGLRPPRVSCMLLLHQFPWEGSRGSPKSGRSSSKIWPRISQVRPNLTQNRPNWARSRPNFARCRPPEIVKHWSEFDQFRSELSQSRPEFARNSPNSPEFGRC